MSKAVSRVILGLRDELGDVVGILEGYVEGAGNILYDGLRFQRAEGYDLPHPIHAIFLGHVIDDLAASFEAEVDVKIRHRNSLRVEEAFEEEVVFQGVDVGDPEGIGDDRACA